MDFGNALLLGLVVFVIVEFAKRLVPVIGTNSRLTILTVLVGSLVTVFLVRYTVWAHEQVIGGHPLDELNFGSLIVAALLLAALSTGIRVGVDAVKNIGQNQ